MALCATPNPPRQNIGEALVLRLRKFVIGQGKETGFSQPPTMQTYGCVLLECARYDSSYACGQSRPAGTFSRQVCMGLTINTAKAHKVRQLGDLTVVFTWINEERAMVIIPTFRKGASWYIVMDSAAWKYDEPRYLAQQSFKAAEVLEMVGHEAKVGGIIHDHLGDLVLMPHAPDQEMSKAAHGELMVKADGKIIGGDELRLPVGEGSTFV